MSAPAPTFDSIRQKHGARAKRAGLFDEWTKALLARRELGKPPLDEEQQRRCLEAAGREMFAAQSDTVTREALQQRVVVFLKEQRFAHAADKAQTVIEYWQARAGILSAAEGEPDRLAFVDRRLRDYFMAMDLVSRARKDKDQQPVREAVLSHLHDPLWDEVSLLAAAKLKPANATHLLEDILNARSWGEDVLQRDRLFAVRLLAEGAAVEPAFAERFIAELADQLLQTHPAAAFRCPGAQHEALATALKALAQSPQREMVSALCQKQLDSRPLIECESWYSVLALTGQATPRLLELSRTAPRNRMRLHAAAALAQTAERPQAIAALLELARTAKGAYIRWAAADRLAQLGEKSSGVEALLALARTSHNQLSRRLALDSLGRSGEPSEPLASELLELARSEPRWEIRRVAAASLGHLGGPVQAIPLLLGLAREAPDPVVRARAARTLGWMGDTSDSTVSGLLDLVRHADDVSVRAGALESLARLGAHSAPVMDCLEEIAGSPVDESLQLLAATALLHSGERRADALVRLGELARSAQQAGVRAKATGALVQAGQASGEQLEVLMDPARTASDAATRLSAVEALGTAGEPAIRDSLLEIARHDPEPAVRDAAYAALQTLSAKGLLSLPITAG